LKKGHDNVFQTDFSGVNGPAETISALAMTVVKQFQRVH
jgi:hypothetical protein